MATVKKPAAKAATKCAAKGGKTTKACDKGGKATKAACKGGTTKK